MSSGRSTYKEKTFCQTGVKVLYSVWVVTLLFTTWRDHILDQSRKKYSWMLDQSRKKYPWILDKSMKNILHLQDCKWITLAPNVGRAEPLGFDHFDHQVADILHLVEGVGQSLENSCQTMQWFVCFWQLDSRSAPQDLAPIWDEGSSWPGLRASWPERSRICKRTYFQIKKTFVVPLMVMITLSWPSPSLIGLQRLWLTLETVLLLSQNTGDRERKTRQYKIDRKYKTLQLSTSLLSSLKSISTRPILSSLPTSSWSNSAMSMKSSSSSYLVVARRSL